MMTVGIGDELRNALRQRDEDARRVQEQRTGELREGASELRTLVDEFCDLARSKRVPKTSFYDKDSVRLFNGSRVTDLVGYGWVINPLGRGSDRHEVVAVLDDGQMYECPPTNGNPPNSWAVADKLPFEQAIERYGLQELKRELFGALLRGRSPS
jgi:hypothetical protein